MEKTKAQTQEETKAQTQEETKAQTQEETKAQVREQGADDRQEAAGAGFATLGSLKNAASPEAVKEFYTHQEALRFTRADLDADPQLLKALENSMLKW